MLPFASLAVNDPVNRHFVHRISPSARPANLQRLHLRRVAQSERRDVFFGKDKGGM